MPAAAAGDSTCGAGTRLASRRQASHRQGPGQAADLVRRKKAGDSKSSLDLGFENRAQVAHNGADGYEIKKGALHFKINPQSRICSYRAWDLSGIPCPHAVCAIRDKGGRPEQYVDPCYSTESYPRTYNYTLEPVGELFWPHTTAYEIHAPVPKKMTGRP